jgi:RNA polymerase sigma-70 factor (ECF subfamily)
MVDGSEDAELVARCVAGDADAFAPLVGRYQGPLFTVALRMVGDREDARDLTQGVFLKAFEKLSTFDPSYRFFSWLYRIAINECLNFRSRRKPQEALGEELAAGETPELYARAEELSRGIEEALMKLPIEYRVVLVLRHFVDLSYDELSEVLLIPERTVKSRLYTARQLLGALLQPWRNER